MAVLPAMSVELPPLPERHRKASHLLLAPSLQMIVFAGGHPRKAPDHRDRPVPDYKQKFYLPIRRTEHDCEVLVPDASGRATRPPAEPTLILRRAASAIITRG